MKWKSIFTRRDEASETDPGSATDPGSSTESGEFTEIADTTIGQLLDYMNASGDGDILDAYQMRLGFGGRQTAVNHTALMRCVTLIAGVASHLLTQRQFRIVKRDGTHDRGTRASDLTDLLSHSLNGWNPASQTIEDAMLDYLLDGNALLVSQSRNGRLAGLHRAIPYTARIERIGRVDYYNLEDAERPGGQFETQPHWRVSHIRWPFATRWNSIGGNSRIGFASQPVILMRPAIEIGRRLDNYILTFLRNGPKPTIHFNIKTRAGEPLPDEETKKEILKYLGTGVRKNKGSLVTFDTDANTIHATPDDKTLANRAYQNEEIARFYGCPPPLIGTHVTEWGQGIAELSRLFIKYGFTQHICRFMSAIAFRNLNKGSRIVMDYTELMRGDPAAMKAMIEAVAGSAQRNPIASEEEQRHLVGLPREVDGRIKPTMQTKKKKDIRTEPETEPAAPANENDPDSMNGMAAFTSRIRMAESSGTD